MKKKNAKRELTPEAANRILLKALQSNNLEANTIPLEVLTSYSNYRKERYILPRVVALIMLLLFLFLPLLFIAPQFDISENEEAQLGRPEYDLTVQGDYPVSRVSAVIDGISMPIYETGERSFSIRPTMNGEMTVTVTLLNEQFDKCSFNVETVDYDAPKLISNEVYGDEVWFVVEDTGLGVDYDSVVAETLSGGTLRPIRVDPSTGTIVFAFPQETLNIYFSDLAGNRLHIVVMPQE